MKPNDNNIDIQYGKFVPESVAQKCPVCTGFGTLNWGKVQCHACKGLGYILLPAREVKETGEKYETNR